MAMAINSPSSGGGSGVGATTGGSGSGAISGNITNTNLNNDVDGSGTAATGNSDLWRECVDWLTRCKIIPSDHKATWPNAEIRVLALSLRDGVLLCNLVIHLDPTSMDQRDFNRKPQMAQFLCCQNIKLFLDVCRNHFGIREADLFDPTMLYDLTHFHRVLITLSKLSQCRKVQQLHPKLVGFNLQLSPSERSHSDEDIYRDLPSTEDMVKKSGSIETPSECGDRNSFSGSLSVEDENSDITIENGTEDTEDYEEEYFSNMCDTFDDEILSVHSGSSGLTATSAGSNHSRNATYALNGVGNSSSSSAGLMATAIMGTSGGTTAMTATPASGAITNGSVTAAVANTNCSALCVNGFSGGVMVSASSGGSGALGYGTGAIAKHSSLTDNQSLQRAAAAAWNYQSSNASEYLNEFYFDEDEKVYEDLCYVTFSSEVCYLFNSLLYP